MAFRARSLIGPHQVRYANERGHSVSIFTRGNREPELPDEVERQIGDRNDDLTALRDREWDVVFDNHTTLPRWVRHSGPVLQGNTRHYVFTSTISVYASEDEAWADETDKLATLDIDPYAATQITAQTYGGLKAEAEAEARRWFRDMLTIVRPGLIVGPRDRSDRFTYWPVRVARGGTVLAPPADDPVQFIDVRDLAEWMVRMAEAREFGVYNATGPEAPLTVAGMLYGIRAVTGGDVRFAFASPEFLEEHGVRPWADLPVWLPDTPDTVGFSRRSIERALSKGLTFRPLAETVADTLEWHRSRPDEERGPALRSGLSPEREAELLAALGAGGRNRPAG